jgi:hypothetical protein
MRRILFSTFLLLAMAGCQRDELPATAPDLLAPLPPAGLVVESAHDGFIFLGWLKNTESDFLHYVIFRAEQQRGPFAAIDSTPRNYYVDGHRSYYSVQYYYVCAVDRSGNRSASSSVVSTASPNLVSPDPPTEFEVAGQNIDGKACMQLSWAPSEAYDVKRYAIFRSDSPVIETHITPVQHYTESTFFIDTAASETGRTYYYAIRAEDMGDKTSPLSEVSFDVIAEAPALVLPPADATIDQYPTFRWRRVPGVLGYRLSVSASPITGEFWSVFVDEQGLGEYSIPYDGPSLVSARAYYWRVSTYTKRNGPPNSVSRARLFQVY